MNKKARITATSPAGIFSLVMLASINACEIVERHNLTHAEYQNAHDYWVGQKGLRPTHISAFNLNGSARFAGVWETPGDPSRWVVRHGLSSAGYQTEFDQWVSRGFWPKVVDGYESSGGAQFAVIFEEQPGSTGVARHNLTRTQLESELDYWKARDYRPVSVQGYSVGGTDYYAALWEPAAGVTWFERHAMTSSEYQQYFDYLVDLGFRVIHVSGYNLGGVDHYAAIWEVTGKPQGPARHRLTAKGYRHEFIDRLLQGYRLDQVDGYEYGGQDRYAALWSPISGETDGSYCKNGWCFSPADAANDLRGELSGSSAVVKWGFELRRGLSVLKDAEGPGRTSTTPPQRDFTVNDRFNPASVSKVVTAVAMLKLLDEASLSPDEPIGRYLPATWNVPSINRSITFGEVLSHTSGLRNDGFGASYDGIKGLMGVPIKLANKVYGYENMNYSLLRILVASLDGMINWQNNPGARSSERFIDYVNQALLEPIGIFDVEWKPTGSAPVLFYPSPTGTSTGTTYGDWSLRPGSAGVSMSVHELAMFMDAVFNSRAGERVLSSSAAKQMRELTLGVFEYDTLPDGSRCWGKGGYFPASRNGGAELNTNLVYCDNGLTAMIAVNGAEDPKPALFDALRSAFTSTP